MNTTEFLQAIKLNITQPTFQQLFDPDDVLFMAKQEQEARVVPIVRSLNEEFFVKVKYLPIAAYQDTASIPRRATGRAVRSLQYLPQGAQAPYVLPRISMQDTAGIVGVQSENPSAVYLLSDTIKLYPVPNQAGTLVQYYEQAPSKPVQTTLTGTILSIGVDTVTLTKTPPINITVGSTCDITQNYPGYQIVYEDLTVINITGNTIQFAGFTVGAPIEGVEVYDSLSLARETSILQLFDEAADLLVQSTSVRILKAMQQTEMAKGIEEEFMKKLTALKQITSPRIEGSIPKVLQRNNLLRSGLISSNWPAMTL